MINLSIGRIGAVLAVGAALVVGAAPSASANHEHITIVNWGGDQTRGQILAMVRPWEEQRSFGAHVVEYNGGIEEIRRQVDSANVTWDVVDMELSDFLRACEEGLLERIDVSRLPPGVDGAAAKDDFVPGSLHECGVGNYVWATVYAYNREDFPDEAPTTIGDFFDTKKFPGKRGLRKDPRGNLEWALLRAGVQTDKVYETLGTPEGLDFAFATLAKLRADIVWWERGPEPVKLLDAKDVVMTAVWNGRLLRPIMKEGKDIVTVWDAQLWEIEMFAIPRGTRHKQRALDFIAFATSSIPLANLSKYISYGPVRSSSHEMVEPDILPMLPTFEDNKQNALRFNSPFWAEHYVAIKERFEEFTKPELTDIQQRGARF